MYVCMYVAVTKCKLLGMFPVICKKHQIYEKSITEKETDKENMKCNNLYVTKTKLTFLFEILDSAQLAALSVWSSIDEEYRPL